jgi:hypothetical protein
MSEYLRDHEVSDEEFVKRLEQHIRNSEEYAASGSILFKRRNPDYSLIPLHVKKMNDEIRVRNGIKPRWSNE